MPENSLYYMACWTEDDGVYSCVHEHATVADAMQCLVPNGAGFIRAMEGPLFRSLNETEWMEFLHAIPAMPWAKLKRVYNAETNRWIAQKNDGASRISGDQPPVKD